MTILDQIITAKRQEVALAKARKPFDKIWLEAQAVDLPALSFSEALLTSDTGIIAEFKRRSPSKGFIHKGADVAAVVAGYSAGGAAAISVLTDREYFGGSLGDLRTARQVAGIPLLRKDFIIDPYQICEARIAGADVVLLIAAALTPDLTSELARFARSLGLEVLLEIHQGAELGHINEYIDVVGVNNRNLATFDTDIAVSEQLATLIPDGLIKISESGISAPETVGKLRKQGFRGFLMGENFMKTTDPALALAGFLKELSE